MLLSSAQDGWVEVASPARDWLLSWRSTPSSLETTEQLFLSLLADLPSALRRGDAIGQQHARQLTSAIQVRQRLRVRLNSSACALTETLRSNLQVFPPAVFSANVLQHSLRHQQLLSTFFEVFSFDAATAGALLYAAAPPSGTATSYSTGASDTQQAGRGPNSLVSAAPAVELLPRMPLGLAVVTTRHAYDAVAGALRAVAVSAIAADADGGPGLALRGLVEGCLGWMQQLVESSAAAPGRAPPLARPSSSSMPAAGEDPWQLQCASGAVVLAELVFGGSPAWRPLWSPSFPTSHPGAAPIPSSPVFLDLVAAAVLQDMVQDAFWSLPTASGGNSLSSSDTRLLLNGPLGQLSAQQLGCNALLLKAALEGCGTAARALGQRFTLTGRMLRAALLPLLEKLGKEGGPRVSCRWGGGPSLESLSTLPLHSHSPLPAADGTQIVCAAAQAAVASICQWCGYGGSLQRLVASNADYVVDGMCRQLRQVCMCS